MSEPTSERSGRPGRASVRQAARRAALAAQAKVRAHRQERDKRLAALATTVLVALGERDAAVITYEQRAGAALRQLFDGEHVSVAEAAQWCGPSLTPREITRLRRLGTTDSALAGTWNQGRQPPERPTVHRTQKPPETTP
ncbi:hypothetical protein [Terrabacter sp. Ter38]|uniref:hypothetical protein n=1 Tax=Terrabacter sp. Ter38 TaxID=2926030 RepID=UPI0021187967|nr:hypothetical protein [Terrabacter sp. Ter38]